MEGTYLGISTLGASDLDGTETAVVTTLAHELHWLAVAEAAEPVGHDAGLWAKGNNAVRWVWIAVKQVGV